MEYQTEIETPIAKHKVVLKTMLTGAEREKVDNAEMQFVKTTDGKSFTVTEMEKIGVAKKHKLLELAVVSIDSDSVDILKRLQKMYELDYEFIYNAILETQKKMRNSIQPAS